MLRSAKAHFGDSIFANRQGIPPPSPDASRCDTGHASRRHIQSHAARRLSSDVRCGTRIRHQVPDQYSHTGGMRSAAHPVVRPGVPRSGAQGVTARSPLAPQGRGLGGATHRIAPRPSGARCVGGEAPAVPVPGRRWQPAKGAGVSRGPQTDAESGGQGGERPRLASCRDGDALSAARLWRVASGWNSRAPPSKSPGRAYSESRNFPRRLRRLGKFRWRG